MLPVTAANALANFAGFGAPSQLTRLAAGGFSGCVIWKVTHGGEPQSLESHCLESLCLKCWPADNPPPARLPWIHQILQRAIQKGLHFLPRPYVTHSGDTTCEVAGATWELMPWMPGEANYRSSPGDTRLQNALRALASFHQATRDQAAPVTATGSASRHVPALEDRLARLEAYDEPGRQRIRAALQASRIPELDPLAAEWLATRWHAPPNAREHLLAATAHVHYLQPAIRDLWHDHVLFTGDEVTGIIDFAAMRMDTPLVDLARLIGSLARDNAAQRSLALDAYSKIAPLTSADRHLIDLLDETSTWIAGWNWLQWLYVERRSFPSLPAVRERLRELLGRRIVSP